MVAGLLALSGCAVAMLLSMGPDQRAALFLVPGDKAVIYIYHDDAIDIALAPVVLVDGEPLGPPTAAGFWYREVAPGRHSVAPSGAEAGGIVLEVEAGRTYFVGEDANCVTAPLPSVHSVTESVGRAHVRSLVAASKSPSAEVREAGTPRCGPAAMIRDGTAL